MSDSKPPHDGLTVSRFIRLLLVGLGIVTAFGTYLIYG